METLNPPLLMDVPWGSHLGKNIYFSIFFKVKCELPSYLANAPLGTHPREMKLCPHKDKSTHATRTDKSSNSPEARVDGWMKGGPSEHGMVFNSKRGGALIQLLPSLFSSCERG